MINGYQPLRRRVAYYETDQMHIVHHSNYIRWFEEARDDCMRQFGIDYTLVEAEGILMPVIGVTCDYKRGATYYETVSLSALPVYFNGVRLRFAYEFYGEDGALLVTGTSAHCFIDARTRKPLNLKRRMPEYCARLEKLITENGETK